ncbi:hypothetical protein LZQ00_10455 [Sphingobacterium sp. SRCM116780]|uniref:hypothetical protein n=1 Tax=Sphingobacterium sp. SRCM116780 TaxID=2907623 RepID=UPI001F1EBAAD|nr:hypothetical protein [Sphingobacterium sp. SRCM116780]UIR54696.1 hypothetical protein LZQ00_10455 [Sphingobacterium sp. SRCM116780]
MKKTAILFLFSLAILFAYAQEKPAAYVVSKEYNLWNFQKGDTAYVFADMAYIRDYPDSKSKLIDSLPEGATVLIASEGYNGNKIRGFYAPWYKITYLKDNRKKEGFIWLGLLALHSIQNEDGEQFIYGFKKFKSATEDEASYYDAEIKVFDREKKCIARATYQASVDGQTGTETKILAGMGLKNIKNIHRSAFLGEACGIATQYYYFAWNGQNLIRFPDKMSVADASVFYHEETILFPSEHKGDQTMIYKKIVEAENSNENLNDEPQYKETKSQINYTWDGTTLSQVLTMK